MKMVQPDDVAVPAKNSKKKTNKKQQILCQKNQPKIENIL